MNKNMTLAQRMKMYETQETSRIFLPLLPIYARIDGRAFHRYTSCMERPFDQAFSDAMIRTTKVLVEETRATIGYTQSDEISLLWYNSKPESETFFGGKIFKMTSVLASIASVMLDRALGLYWLNHNDILPVFDARVIQLPTLEEAANMILWRTNDAVKNSISMAAHSVFSDKELHGKSQNERQEMLFQKGINWEKYPQAFKEGMFVRRTRVLEPVENIRDIPPSYIDSTPTHVTRHHVLAMTDWPRFSKITNKISVLFNGDIPHSDPILDKSKTLTYSSSLT